MNIQSIYNLGSLINLALIILTVAASFYVLKKSVIKAKDEITQQTAEAQRNAIEAMHEEIEALNWRVNEMRTQNIKLEHIITTICAALKTRGIIISIDGEMITILDNNSHSSTSARIQEEQATHGETITGLDNNSYSHTSARIQEEQATHGETITGLNNNSYSHTSAKIQEEQAS